MKTIFPFKRGRVKFNLTKPSFNGQRYSFWTIHEGRFQCKSKDCNHVFEEGDEVLPVYWKETVIPTNFVCSLYRGLLKDLSIFIAIEKGRKRD